MFTDVFDNILRIFVFNMYLSVYTPQFRQQILEICLFFPYRSTIRALIKNFSIASFFPAFITLLFFQHNRTAYDIVAGTIVVKRHSLRWYSRTPLFHCSNILEPLCWTAESHSRTVPITTLSLLSSRGAIYLGDRCWTDLRIFEQSQNTQNLQKSLAVSKE